MLGEKTEQIEKVLNSLKEVLITKNKKYGNAALEPLNVFYKGNGKTSIEIRLDDKLSRIKNSSELRKNDVFDLMGYLVLLIISIEKQKFEYNFEDEVNEIVNDILLQITELEEYIILDSEQYEKENFEIFFNKEKYNSNITFSIDFLLNKYKRYNNVNDQITIIYNILRQITLYFVDNNITDFSELID